MILSSKIRLLIVIGLSLISCAIYAASDSATIKHIDLKFTAEELNWIKQNPIIKVAPDPQFPPFESMNSNGLFRGISTDYQKLIEKRTGLKFEIIHIDNWTEILQSFREGKIDLLPAIAKTPQREQYMDFMTPHIVVPGVIITSKDFTSLKQLYGHRVAVVVDQVWDELITSRHFDVNLVRVKNHRDGIELAAMGAVDAMVTDLASVTYYLKSESIFNLRIVKYLKKNLELGFAVQKEQPILKSILQKSINSLTKEEKEKIKNKWITVEQPGLWQYKKIWLSIIIVFVTVILFMVLIIVWNRSLRKRVEQRTEELKAAQLELIQAEKMDSIGRVATGIAHEVKNPLTIIQMGVEYLADEVNQNTSNKEILVDINNAINRADQIISSFLDYSAEKKLKLESGNINRVIEKSVKLLEHKLNENNVDCELKLSNRIDNILIDENKLQQVIVNLLLNSVDALKDQDSKNIIISTGIGVLEREDIKSLFPANAFKKGEEVIMVSISDMGCGINASNVDKLFEPFFTTKPVGSGTGLGLPVSLKIIEMHQGAIGIKNRQKGGTIVTIVMRLDPTGEG
jgi:signal transduction histidine kinase